MNAKIEQLCRQAACTPAEAYVYLSDSGWSVEAAKALLLADRQWLKG